MTKRTYDPLRGAGILGTRWPDSARIPHALPQSHASDGALVLRRPPRAWCRQDARVGLPPLLRAAPTFVGVAHRAVLGARVADLADKRLAAKASRLVGHPSSVARDVAPSRAHAALAGLRVVPSAKTRQRGSCAPRVSIVSETVDLARVVGSRALPALMPERHVRHGWILYGAQRTWQRPNMLGPWSTLICGAVPRGAAIGTQAIARHGQVEPCRRERLGVRAADPFRFAFESRQRWACDPSGSRGALGCSSIVGAGVDWGRRLRCGALLGPGYGGWCRAGANEERPGEQSADVHAPHGSTVAPTADGVR